MRTQKGLKGGQSLRVAVGNPSLKRWISKWRHHALSTLPSLISSSFFISLSALQGEKRDLLQSVKKNNTHIPSQALHTRSVLFCQPLDPWHSSIQVIVIIRHNCHASFSFHVNPVKHIRRKVRKYSGFPLTQHFKHPSA